MLIATRVGLWQYNEDKIVWSVDEHNDPAKQDFLELAIYPNPFNDACIVETEIQTNITIYDINGTYIDKIKGGKKWTPDRSLATGVYLFVATQNDFCETKKVVYLK